jgi:hypothetical protein
VALTHPQRGAAWIGALSKPMRFEGVENSEINDLALASCLGCSRRRDQIQAEAAKITIVELTH